MTNTKKITSLAMTLDISKFKKVCSLFTPEIAVMVRGRHGIGKSEVVYQVAQDLRDDFYKDPQNCARMLAALQNEPAIAKKIKQNGGSWSYEMGVPVIERRLSQMTEGDIIGLPFLESSGTEFRPVMWLMNGCHFPVVLFLDELNRAIKGVEQATFQLADSKAFYGNLLHPGTRIYIAVNIGASYAVEDFDPAAISRYATIDLEPSVEEFLIFARANCNPFLADFISSNREALEHREENFEPNVKYPDRRAWVKLDKQLAAAGLYNTPEDLSFLHMSAAMVGFAYGNAYWEHVRSNNFNVSGEDIALRWKEVRKNLPKNETIRQQKYMELAHRLSKFLEENSAGKDFKKEVVGPNIQQFATDCPAEGCIVVWTGLTKNKDNIAPLVGFITDIIVKRTTRQEVASPAESAEQQEDPANPVTPRKR